MTTRRTRRRRQWLKRLALGALGFLLVAILAGFLALAALRSARGQRVLLGRLSAWTTAELGFAVDAESLQLRPLAATLEIETLRLTVDDGPPFLAAKSVRARWRNRALLRRRLALERLELEGLLIDTRSPLPVSAASEAPAEGGEDPLPLRIERFELRDASLLGGPAGDRLDGWAVTGLDLEAGFDGRRIEIRELLGDVSVTTTGATASHAGALSGRGTVDLGGTATVDRLDLTANALHLALSGHFGPALGDNRGSFRLEIDPGEWVRQRPSGPLVIAGDLDLETWSGELRLEHTEQPADLFADFLPAQERERLELASSTLRLAADLRLEADRLVTGAIEAGLRRGDLRVAEVVARPRVTLDADFPLTTRFTAVLLPADPGVRRLEGRLSTPAAGRLADWRIDEASSTLELPATESALLRVARLYPRLLDPAPLADLPPIGRLTATGDLRGRLADPMIRQEVELRPAGSGRARATASGRPLSGPIRLTTTGSELEMSSFVPTLSGRVDWSGSIDDALGNAGGRVELAVRELTTSEGPVLDELNLDLVGGADRIEWRLAAAAGARRLDGDGTLDPRPPIRHAAGELTVLTGDERAPRLKTSFTLAAGTLSAEVATELAGREGAVLDARVPLAALDALPALAVLGRLPLKRSSGPIEVGWTVAPDDWTDLLSPSLAGRMRGLTAGSSGRFLLDLECLACSEGHARVAGVAVELDGRRLFAADDLLLDLASRRLTVAPWSLTGEGFRLEIDGASDLAADWRPGDAVSELARHLNALVSAEIDSTWFESLPVEVSTPGSLRLRAEVEGPPDGLAGEILLDAPDLALAPTARPDLVLSRPSARFELAEGIVKWSDASVLAGGATLTSSGQTRLEAPLADASGRLDLTTGLPVLEAAALSFVIEEGEVRVADGVLTTTGGTGSIALELPLQRRPGGRLRLELDVPANDWAPLAKSFAGDDPEVLEASLRGVLELPFETPALARGNFVLEDARIVVRGRETRFSPRLAISTADGRLEIAPFELTSAGETFSFRARAELAPAWVPEDPPATLVPYFEVLGSGAVDAGLLNPWLAGGRGEGSLGLEIAVSGSAEDYAGRFEVEGPQASILFRSPYLARFQDLDLDFTVRDGRITLDRGTALLNEGPLELGGLVWDGSRVDLRAKVSGALFRLDYGLLATLGADLRFGFDTEGTSTLTGSIDLDRGSLTRDLQLDFDFLSEFLAPVDLTTTEEGFTDLVELDLSVRTRAGVRVKNNLADLLVRWEPLAVTGTLARPVLEGRLEADPSGLLHLYGQTVRLDQAAIEYPGVENQEARLDLEVTTSLEDPTIGRLEGQDPFRTSQRELPGSEPTTDVGADLARYWGEQFAGRVGEAVGFKVSLRPLLIFGETDPGARLTVSHDLSPQLALAASVNLREAEGQTYLLELHELGRLPQLVAQGFSDDQSTYGGVLLQRRELGGSVAPKDADLPRVRKLTVQPPPAVSRRGIRRAIGLAKGDPFDAERRFAAEVELADFLLRKGYADARVSVLPVEVPNRPQRLDLEVAIRPGPRALFEFEGEKLPKALREVISALYRADFFEAESILEMRAESVRALRSRGFLDPEVAIRVDPLDPQDPAGDRRVRVSTLGGEKISLEPPVFLGLPPADAEALAVPFFNTVQRVELAVGLESADRRLLRTLADRGYPEARIARRYQGLTNRVLTVEIEPGPRRHIASVTVVPAADGSGPLPEGLAPLVTVTEGEPLLRRELSRSALALERELGSRGHLDARVLTHLEPAGGADPTSVAVRFEVLPGSMSRLAAVEFTGLASTRESWARRATGLQIGRALERDALARARTALWRTGLFSAVFAESQEIEPGVRKAVFDLVERPRYRLAYGVRWDSSTGVGVVLDASDDNFLGRGWTLGLRALDSSDERSLRLLTRVPRAFGGPGSLEFFAGASEITEPFFDRFGSTDVIAEILEGTLQYSHPLSPRTTLRLYSRYTDTKRDLPFLTVRIKNPLLGVQLLYDGRSSEPLTLRGTFASLDFSASDDLLGGDLSYARLFSQVSHHRPLARLGGRRLTWSQSLRAGLAEAFDDQRLIQDVLFFAGGEYSVRGYETESLGELAQFGSVVEAVGGAALLVVNQELRWSFLEDYTAIAFVDAGNVWSSIGGFGLDLLASAGVGLRAVTPVGLLRLDFAHALDRRPEIDPEFKLYFGLGTTF